jgi:hypothetical protein
MVHSRGGHATLSTFLRLLIANSGAAQIRRRPNAVAMAMMARLCIRSLVGSARPAVRGF